MASTERNHLDPVRMVISTLDQAWVPWVLGERWGDAQNQEDPEDPGTWCSIADAEALECLMLPQFLSSRLSLADPDRLDPELVEILNRLNTNLEDDALGGRALNRGAQLAIVDRLVTFFQRHSRADDGAVPVFRSGPYFNRVVTDPLIAQADLPPTVDDYTMSLSVSVHSAHLFQRWYDELSQKEKAGHDGEELRAAREVAKRRLGASMLGLLRSFAISPAPDWAGSVGFEFPKGSANPIAELRRRFRTTFPGIEAHVQGSNPFECGFSWGQTRLGDLGGELGSAQQALFGPDDPHDEVAVLAQPAPYLYFTVTALEGIADLQSRATRQAGFLDGTLAALAQRLGQLAEMTSTFWAEVALGRDPQRWPIEEIPWRTTDGSESDYWTLYLLLIITSGSADRFRDDASLERLLLVLEELAQRARVTRRPHPATDDPAVLLHIPPGTGINLLVDSEADGASACASGWSWSTYDFAPKLFKLAARAYGRARDRRLRERAEDLVNAIWFWHLDQRRISPERAIWDDPKQVKDYARTIDWPTLEAGNVWSAAQSPSYAVGSWYITERVVEGLTALIAARGERSFSSTQTRDLAFELIGEARHTRSTRVTEVSPKVQEVDRLLERARSLLDEAPGSSLALALEANRHLADASI